MIHLIFTREAIFNVQGYNETSMMCKRHGVRSDKIYFSEGGVQKHGKYIMHSLYYYTMQLRFGMFLIPVLLVFMYMLVMPFTYSYELLYRIDFVHEYYYTLLQCRTVLVVRASD